MLIVLFVGLCTLFAQAQQTYSKMFDVFGEWEGILAPFQLNDSSFLVYGETINFGAVDSTRFSRGFISTFSNSQLSTNVLIGKNKYWYKPYEVYSFQANKHILLFNVQYDTSGTIGVHHLLDINHKGDTSNERIIECQDSSFGLTSSFNLKNRIYLFGFKGLSSLDPFAILCSDTSGKQIWYKKFAGKRTRASSVVLGNDGHFLLGGYVYRGDGISDSIFGWYAKMDTAGNLLWEKTMDFSSQYYLANCELSKYENRYFINGSNDPSLPVHYNKDSAFTYLLEFDNSGKILSYKRPITHPDKQRVFVGYYTYKNGFRYGIGGYYTTEGTEYIMLVKLDLQGNLIWKRLFKQWFRDNRAWSLTAVNDGFIICADGKDSTHTTGFTDAWIIKTDTNGCVVPGCHLKDGLVQLLNPELLLSVYPNPANNQLNITITDNRAALKSVVLYDALGNQTTLPQQTFNSTQAILNTTLLQTGYYYVVIELLTGERAVKKVLVGH